MKKLLTIIFGVISFTALAANQATPLTTNKASAYATTGQSPVFNGTQWVFVSTNVFGSSGTASNAIANLNGLGTNTSLFGNVGIGTTNPSHTLHVVTATNNAVGVDSTGTDSSSMFHIHNYADTQGPFFDFGAPPGRWGFGMSSVGSFNLRFTQDTNTDPVNGTTLVVFSTNGVITGDGSGLTNIPGSALQSPLNVSSMNVGTLTATNTFLTNGYYFHTNATTGQWGYWDTNGVHFESNFLSGVWWWRGPTNSMSGVAATTNFQTSAVSGAQTNTGPIQASKFYGDGSALTGVSGSSQIIVPIGGETILMLNTTTSNSVSRFFPPTYSTADANVTVCAATKNALVVTNMIVSLLGGALGPGTNLYISLATNALNVSASTETTFRVILAGGVTTSNSLAQSFTVPANNGYGFMWTNNAPGNALVPNKSLVFGFEVIR